MGKLQFLCFLLLPLSMWVSTCGYMKVTVFMLLITAFVHVVFACGYMKVTVFILLITAFVHVGICMWLYDIYICLLILWLPHDDHQTGQTGHDENKKQQHHPDLCFHQVRAAKHQDEGCSQFREQE